MMSDSKGRFMIPRPGVKEQWHHLPQGWTKRLSDHERRQVIANGWRGGDRRSSSLDLHHGHVRNDAVQDHNRAQPFGRHGARRRSELVTVARQAAPSGLGTGRLRRLRRLLPGGPRRALATFEDNATPRSSTMDTHLVPDEASPSRASFCRGAASGGADGGHAGRHTKLVFRAPPACPKSVPQQDHRVCSSHLPPLHRICQHLGWKDAQRRRLRRAQPRCWRI